ncbi:hypothetical protein SteCoe_5287 [Stentor coeruleus]|uniref:Uncharacterized protein n=1 Tax=Stentor coeruleus TaxID=5963 RepID=A0A1R2CSY4_9CILI|nr:hypothetical protein SteCoe_5287 [Stentor coeruleus]
MIKLEDIQNLRAIPEIKDFLLKSGFSKFILIQPNCFPEIVFLAFVDYFYIYQNNYYEFLLVSLAEKNKNLFVYVQNLLAYLKSANIEIIKSGAHYQNPEYLQFISLISRTLLNCTQTEIKSCNTDLFIAYLRYILSLSSNFKVFEFNSTRAFTRSYGNSQHGIIYFIKIEGEYCVLYPEVYPKYTISINYSSQYPRAVLSCGQPITENIKNYDTCNYPTTHRLYTQEKCLIQLKSPYGQYKNICFGCKMEKQSGYICERCECINCHNCIRNPKQFLCKKCGFSNIFKRFKEIPNLENQVYQNFGNTNYSQYYQQSSYGQNYSAPQMQNPHTNFSQTPPNPTQPCVECKKYTKCKNCVNFIYGPSISKLCELCLLKKCKICDNETFGFRYCKKCHGCSKCNKPMESILVCCMECNLKKKFNLQIDVLSEKSELKFSSEQSDTCLNCNQHKDDIYCCKCKNLEYTRMCQDCKAFYYKDYHPFPQISEPPALNLLNSKMKTTAERLNKSNCKCNVDFKGELIEICGCEPRRIIVPRAEMIEEQLDLYMKTSLNYQG